MPVEGAPAGRARRLSRRRPRRPARRASGVRVRADARRLKAFGQWVRGGGTVVCLNNAAAFAIQHFNLPVRNVVAGLKPEEFFLRGSIVQVTTDPSSQVMAGHAGQGGRVRRQQPGVRDARGLQGHGAGASYQQTGSPLLSGYLIGEDHLHGRAAALDVQLDAGHVVLIGFRPEWRDQPFGTFRVIFNAALSGR